jgi:prevent-host-death family protein
MARMPEIVPMHQAKTTLSQLVQRAAAGETILIGPHGEPLVKLVSLSDSADRAPKRRLGGLKGRMRVAKDFDDPLPDDIQDAFEGKAR